MSKFVTTLQIVDDYEKRKSENPIEFFNSMKMLKDKVLEVEDDEGEKSYIDEDTLCDLYGDEAAGGAAFVEGGAMLFETLEEQETWESQK